MTMMMFIFRRLIQTIPVVIGVTFVVFFIMQLVPGDPAVLLAGEGASKETVNAIRAIGVKPAITGSIF